MKYDSVNHTSPNIDLFLGIKLDPSQIERNAGMRQLAKLMLNSFWGKVTPTTSTVFVFMCILYVFTVWPEK